jgi:uncharacterized membrane protein
MFLSKIKQNEHWIQLGEYFTWLAFISCVLVFSNGFASLDKIGAYHLNLLSVLLSFGLILFCSMVESLVAAVFLEALRTAAKRLLRIDLAFPLRILLLAALVMSLALMVILIFVL